MRTTCSLVEMKGVLYVLNQSGTAYDMKIHKIKKILIEKPLLTRLLLVDNQAISQSETPLELEKHLCSTD